MSLWLLCPGKCPPLEQHPWEGELPLLVGPPQRLEQQFDWCCGWGIPGNSQGATGWLKGPQPACWGHCTAWLVHPITSGRIHGASPTWCHALGPSSLGKAEDSIQGQVETFQGWDFGDTRPRELSSGCIRHGLSSSAPPGEPEGTQTSHCTSQEGWDSQNRSRERHPRPPGWPKNKAQRWLGTCGGSCRE